MQRVAKTSSHGVDTAQIGESLVAVVIPAFNAEKTLDQTLRSVRNQSHANLEIIVINDGSTDSTEHIAQLHMAEDPRISVFYQENGGVARARNKGWQLAKAEWISFIDADDLWSPKKIETQLKLVQEDNLKPGLVYCWSVIIDNSSNLVGCIHGGGKYHGWVLRDLVRINFIGNGSAVLVHRDILEAVGGFDPSLRNRGGEGCEDYLFALHAANLCEFRVAPSFLVGYRIGPNTMSSDKLTMLKSRVMVTEELENHYPLLQSEIQFGLRRYAVRLVAGMIKKRPKKIFNVVKILGSVNNFNWIAFGVYFLQHTIIWFFKKLQCNQVYQISRLGWYSHKEAGAHLNLNKKMENTKNLIKR